MVDKKDNKFVRQMETTQPSESISSVELKQTSKGVNITVKVYNADPDKASQKVVTLFNELKKKYPTIILKDVIKKI